jgi:hypothetical protein
LNNDKSILAVKIAGTLWAVFIIQAVVGLP